MTVKVGAGTGVPFAGNDHGHGSSVVIEKERHSNIAKHESCTRANVVCIKVTRGLEKMMQEIVQFSNISTVLLPFPSTTSALPYQLFGGSWGKTKNL